jgi:hypothetical protein
MTSPGIGFYPLPAKIPQMTLGSGGSARQPNVLSFEVLKGF